MPHIRGILLFSILLVIASPSLLAQQAAKQPEILGDVAAAAQAWDMIRDGALLIDVRSPEEYGEGHIDGSVNIPHTEIDQLVKLIGEDHSRPVVVYCRSGNRSGRTQTALQKMGYTGVFNGTGYEALKATKP
jgi:phage shock protein E